MDLGLGRLPSPDDRDRGYRAMRMIAAPKPDMKTTWRFRGAVLDQGSTGTCVGHAWKHFKRCAPIETNTGPSAFDIYDACTKVDVWSDNDNDTARQFGTSVRAGAQVLTEQGRLKSYVWAFTLAEATMFLLDEINGGPMVLGTNWYGSMFTPNAEGFVKIVGTDIAGGHAYLLRGIDMRRGVAALVNSWGVGWGKKGHFYMALETLERLITEDGEACAAIEQRLTAKVA